MIKPHIQTNKTRPDCEKRLAECRVTIVAPQGILGF